MTTIRTTPAVPEPDHAIGYHHPTGQLIVLARRRRKLATVGRHRPVGTWSMETVETIKPALSADRIGTNFHRLAELGTVRVSLHQAPAALVTALTAEGAEPETAVLVELEDLDAFRSRVRGVPDDHLDALAAVHTAATRRPAKGPGARRRRMPSDRTIDGNATRLHQTSAPGFNRVTRHPGYRPPGTAAPSIADQYAAGLEGYRPPSGEPWGGS